MTANGPVATREPPSACGTPDGDDERVFREAWEAQAFAIMTSLREQGNFSATEWSATLGDEIRRSQAAGNEGTGESSYLTLLSALERIVVEKRMTTHAALRRCRDDWEDAARRTSHGKPIMLVRRAAE